MATMCVPTLGSKEGVTGRLCNVIITLMATNKNNPKQNASTSKRMRQEDTDDDVDIPKTTSWPRYLVMTGSDILKPLTNLSPFVLWKGVQGIADKSVIVKRLFSGDVLLQVSKQIHSEAFLACTNFADFPVTVTPHKSLNSCKGVIRTRDLVNCPLDQIIHFVDNVIDAKRIITKRDGKEIPTNTIILTFDIPKTPTYIKAGYLNIPVSPYIPNPLRCFNCQRFGHASNRCKRTVMCARCAEEGHNDQNCTQAYKCVNCGESHPAYKKDCRAYKCEYQIQYIKTTKNVSFVEARNEYVKQSSGAPSGGSYASAVRPDKPKYTSISTQTDIQWVKDQAIVKNTEEVRTITPTVAKSVSVQCDTMLSDTVLSTPAKPSNAGDAVKPPEGNTSTKAKPGDSSTSSAGTVKSCTADETEAGTEAKPEQGKRDTSVVEELKKKDTDKAHLSVDSSKSSRKSNIIKLSGGGAQSRPSGSTIIQLSGGGVQSRTASNGGNRQIPKKNKDKKRQSMADRRLLPPAHYENLSANSSLTEDMDTDFPALIGEGGANISI